MILRNGRNCDIAPAYTGLSRASLTLSPGNKLQFETIVKITNALGVPLSIKLNDAIAHP